MTRIKTIHVYDYDHVRVHLNAYAYKNKYAAETAKTTLYELFVVVEVHAVVDSRNRGRHFVHRNRKRTN
jgi:hypothetical protein